MRQLFAAKHKEPAETIQSIAVAFAEGDGDLLAALNAYIDMRKEMGKALYPTQFKSSLEGYLNETKDKRRIAKAIWVAVTNGWVRVHLDVIPENHEGTKDMTVEERKRCLADETF